MHFGNHKLAFVSESGLSPQQSSRIATLRCWKCRAWAFASDPSAVARGAESPTEIEGERPPLAVANVSCLGSLARGCGDAGSGRSKPSRGQPQPVTLDDDPPLRCRVG